MALRQALRDQGDWLPRARRCSVTPGKVIHFASQSLWNETLLSPPGGRLRLFRMDGPKSDWINPLEFPHCLMKGHEGLRCFFRYSDLPEEDWSEAESVAVASHSVRRDHVQEAIKSWGAGHSGTMQLLQYSQLVRFSFNRGKAFRDFYDERLRHVIHHSGGGTSVALHIRRGDACNGELMRRTSRVDEVTLNHQRRCYAASVYAEKLATMQQLYNATDVYISSTDPGALGEFRKEFPEQYQQLNWHYLEVDHAPLQGSAWYEYRAVETTQAIGPGSWADLWHLSHGNAIIGNMASHFTRSAWQLAMGRQGRFVPYISVDGRSACCDVANTCLKHAVENRTMHDCLTYRIEPERACFSHGAGPPISHFGP